MALSSQMPRTNDSGRTRMGSMYHKRKTSRAPFLIGAVAVAGALGAWWLLRPTEPRDVVGATLDENVTEPAVAPGETLGSAAPMLREPTTDPRTARTPEPDPHSVIEMGAKPAPTTPQTVALPDPGSSTNLTGGTGQTGAQPNSTPTGAAQAPPQTAPPTSAPALTAIGQSLADAARLEAGGRPLEARTALNRALHDPRATESEREAIRDRMTKLNDLLILSPTVVAGEPFTSTAVVQGGDTLTKITTANGLQTDWRFVMRVNNISAPNKLAVGQKLKLIKGPFHAVVSKSAFRLDLYIGEPDASGNRLFVRSFPVGLGEFGSTPVGNFVVRPNSKLINPSWRNPRTGEFFTADDPKNPLGEYWVGVDPADAASAQYTEYGLHGTIDPDSIGYERSMGCVRLAEPDIRLLYEALVDRVSTVRIVP